MKTRIQAKPSPADPNRKSDIHRATPEPKPREWLIRQARQRIKDGTYDRPDCLDAAIDGILRDLGRRKRKAGRSAAA
jgi:hypothetical protein